MSPSEKPVSFSAILSPTHPGTVRAPSPETPDCPTRELQSPKDGHVHNLSQRLFDEVDHKEYMFEPAVISARSVTPPHLKHLLEVEVKG